MILLLIAAIAFIAAAAIRQRDRWTAPLILIGCLNLIAWVLIR